MPPKLSVALVNDAERNVVLAGDVVVELDVAEEPENRTKDSMNSNDLNKSNKLLRHLYSKHALKVGMESK